MGRGGERKGREGEEEEEEEEEERRRRGEERRREGGEEGKEGEGEKALLNLPFKGGLHMYPTRQSHSPNSPWSVTVLQHHF